MIVNFKKLVPNAVEPQFAYDTDGAADLTCITKEYNDFTGVLTLGTGLAVEIPPGHVGLLFARSSVFKSGLSLCNGLGLIDSEYRGELMFKFYKNKEHSIGYEIGDRIGQIMIIPRPIITYIQTNNLSISSRNTGSFGSTGGFNEKKN